MSWTNYVSCEHFMFRTNEEKNILKLVEAMRSLLDLQLCQHRYCFLPLLSCPFAQLYICSIRCVYDYLLHATIRQQDNLFLAHSRLSKHGREQEVWTSEPTCICNYAFLFSVAELKHITSDVLLLDHPAKDDDK